VFASEQPGPGFDALRAGQAEHQKKHAENRVNPWRGLCDLVASMIQTLLQDLRFAWRGFTKAPGFTAIAVATLGLGIGANSAIFTVVNAILVRPLPYANADRLVRVTADFSAINVSDIGMSSPELADYRDRSGLFEGIAGVWAINANLTEVDQPERVEVLLASPSYFDVLGVHAQLGRLFGPQDNAPGITEVVVISDELWHRRFAGSPQAIGRKLRIDNDWYTVVGVLPPDFKHPGRSVLTEVDVWAPCNFSASPFPSPPPRGGYFITGAIARLRPGVSIEEARHRLAAFGDGLRTSLPYDYPARAGWTPRIIPLQEDLVGSVRSSLLMLFGAVGFVLLIACANVANLLLARGSGRQRELGVRRALGSSRGRLVALLLTESVLLAALGGIAGAAVAVWLIEALFALVPAGLPRLSEIVIDQRVLIFNAALALMTAVVFGTLPALQYSRTDITHALREGSRGSSGRRPLGSALVIAEFSMALVLLVGATLFVRSLWRLQHIDLGFNPDNVVTARLWLPQPNDPKQGRYFTHAARIALFDEVLRRARALPGVSGVAAAQALPFDGTRNTATMTIEGHELDAQGRVPAIQTNVASAGYFELIGARLVRGRTFTEQDHDRAAPVAIVTESMANRYWPGEDPIGRRVHFGGAQAKSPWMTVVGVVNDIRTGKLEEPARPTLFRPLRQASSLSLSIVMKSKGDPRTLGAALAREVRNADADQPTYGVRPLTELVSTSIAARRFTTQLLFGFAVLALILAAIGIYGVMAFLVGQRTREIGIRMALGARPESVVALVLGHALALAAGGVVFGGLAALLMGRLLAQMLYEVRPTDPLTYVAIAIVLAGTAAVAAWWPARRAAAVDPMVALRAE
jgi:putative ABC transport system permease protein